MSARVSLQLNLPDGSAMRAEAEGVEGVVLVFEDVERDNWAEAGKLASDG